MKNTRFTTLYSKKSVLGKRKESAKALLKGLPYPDINYRKRIIMRKLIRTIVLIVSIAVFCFSAYKLYDYYSEMKQGEDAVDELKNVAVTEVREGEKAPISVDFAALKAENPDIVAWLYSADTPINYPVVQSDDNNYYLRRLTDGSYNSNGTLFVDFRDAPDFSGFNTIIYGHRMKSKAMFGTLPGYLEQEYYEEHPVMYLLTPDASYKLELVSSFILRSDSDIYDPMESDEAKNAFLDKMASDSTFKSETEYSVNDRFVCLSTCTYEFENARLMVVGKLIKL